jgi:hypothetical protein
VVLKERICTEYQVRIEGFTKYNLTHSGTFYKNACEEEDIVGFAGLKGFLWLVLHTHLKFVQ